MANSGVVVVIAGQNNSEAVLKQVEASLARVQARAKETSGALSDIGNIGGKALAAFGITLGAQQVLSALESTVKGALDFGTEIENASKKTGLAVSTLSVLHYAADITGGDFENISRAVGKLGKTIGEAADGNQKADGFLRALGSMRRIWRDELMVPRWPSSASRKCSLIRRVQESRNSPWGCLAEPEQSSFPCSSRLGITTISSSKKRRTPVCTSIRRVQLSSHRRISAFEICRKRPRVPA